MAGVGRLTRGLLVLEGDEVGFSREYAPVGDSLNQRIVLDTVGEALLLIPVAVKATMQK
jgi:hypothetical protein